MDSSRIREIKSIIMEMEDIISKLNRLSINIESEFLGIGEDNYANALLNEMYRVKKSKKILENTISAHSGSGGSRF